MPCNTDIKRSPCAVPIDTIDNVLKWEGVDDYYVGVAPLEPTQRLENAPRTLVCHDMAGGYLEDKFVQGSDKYDAYRFYHWHLVDTFVYFSHHMITIPPPCWINAAHKHGVPVLGTFITEWEDGLEKCNNLLSDVEKIDKFVDQMVNIAVHHSMDGWLINIENNVQYEHIGNLVHFIELLTQRMHIAIPGSQVIWYDSVTKYGDLLWQNELNDLNSVFFNACDGIFLNYTWTTDQLVNSAICSGNRLNDVFVGIDVFGRGMIGGGGYNTKEALALARNAQLSIALFAPGWVYEVNGSREFDANEERFWYYLQPYLTMHVSCSLPMSSSFCQGWGKNIYMHGKVLSNDPWSNLSMQQPQPTLTHCEMGHNPHQQYKWLHLEDGFMGGGAMRFVGLLPNTGKALTHRVFDSAINTDNTAAYVRYTMKQLNMDDGAKLFLYLILNKAEGERERRILLPAEYSISSVYDGGENDITLQCLDESTIPQALKSPIVSGRDANEWQSRVFYINSDMLQGNSLDEIGIMAYTDNEEPLKLSILLGNVQVLSETDPTLHPISVSDISADNVLIDNLSRRSDMLPVEDAGPKCLTTTLRWNRPDIDADVTSYHVWYSVNGGERQWINSTYSNKFYISNLELNGDSGSVQFTVQVQYKSGVIQEIDQSGTCLFNF